MNPRLMAQRLGLLFELVPPTAKVGVFVNPNNLFVAAASIADAEAAASATGRPIEVLSASSGEGIDAAFASLAGRQIGALVVSPDVLFSGRREQLVTLAARHRLPTIYSVRELPEAGGLMSYGPSLSHQFRQAGIYTGRILNGEKPGDLPVIQSTEFEFVINLRTARALGIEVPPSLRALATEVMD